jgi:HEXXH motif-containing protein
MDDLFDLPGSAATELGLRRACQLALLRDRLSDTPPQQFLPAWLETLSLADLLRRATPFFWLNVSRCHAACVNASSRLIIALRYLLLTGFDALFPLLPDGFSCCLPAGDEPILVLPRLGVRLPASDGPLRLCRVSDKVLRVEDGQGLATTVPLDDIPATARLAWLPVGQHGSARLLLHAHPALFPDCSALDIPPDPARHAALLNAALQLIGEVDPRRGEQIENAIGWYVSLSSDSPAIHQARTMLEPRGVLFLSPVANRRILAEAIVRAYCQDVLRGRMAVEKLLAFGDEARFYAPWWDEPRPLAGLLHALFGFTGVAEFLLRAEKSPALAEEQEALREHRRLVVEQLRLGHAQALPKYFTPAGQRLLAGLKAIIDRHEAELQLPPGRLPDTLVAHLRKWCAAHFHLAVEVRRPVRSGS